MQLTDPNGSTSWNYDSHGRPIQRDGSELTYTYDTGTTEYTIDGLGDTAIIIGEAVRTVIGARGAGFQDPARTLDGQPPLCL